MVNRVYCAIAAVALIWSITHLLPAGWHGFAAEFGIAALSYTIGCIADKVKA